MVDPLLALIVAGGLAAAAVLLFWPVQGLLWRGRSLLRANARVLIEDALKHVHDCEYRRVPSTLHSLSGALGISGNRAADLLSRLERMELVTSRERTYKLTPEGRTYALRIIRTHRLWERYLSDRTSLDAAEWHREAEVREHKTSPEEADALAAQMGHPHFDPHGDPIPTGPGEIAPPRGRPLTDLPPGRLGVVVHVEDEPPAVYAQLVAENIHPGMRVRVLEAGAERIRFEADAEEVVLAPVVAANIAAVPLPEEEEMAGPFDLLSSLERGRRAEVLGISRACRGPERRRLFDLGVIPGTVVEAEMESPGGDPVAYRIRGAVIALRREQAEMIHVKPLTNGRKP